MNSKTRYLIDPRIRIVRGISGGTHKFKDVFAGFEKLDAVKQIFGENTNYLLSRLRVEVFPREGYMLVSDEDGHLVVSQYYLKNGEEWSVYLDVIHELVHVRQFYDGRELFDSKYSYADRPTEIEAYRVCVEEARRIGLTEEEIFGYLEVPWMSKKDHERLAKHCDVLLN